MGKWSQKQDPICSRSPVPSVTKSKPHVKKPRSASRMWTIRPFAYATSVTARVSGGWASAEAAFPSLELPVRRIWSSVFTPFPEHPAWPDFLCCWKQHEFEQQQGINRNEEFGAVRCSSVGPGFCQCPWHWQKKDKTPFIQKPDRKSAVFRPPGTFLVLCSPPQCRMSKAVVLFNIKCT